MSRILAEASASFDQRAGVGRYSRAILDRLIPAMADDTWTLFHAPAGADRLWTPPAGTRVVRYPLSRRRLDQLGGRLGLPLPIRLLTGAQDLVYSPDFVAPALRGVPSIVTIHDIAWLTHPHLTTPGAAAFLDTVVRRAVDRGAMVATVSETTCDRVIERWRLPAERVRVIRNGVDEHFLHAEPPTAMARERLGLPERYLLMVGTVEPRKNHAAVIRALRRHPRGLPVVVVGQPGWGTDAEQADLRALDAEGRIRWLGSTDDAVIPALYAGSHGVLYPSWTEGFGLPVLEALAAGRPVITGTDPVFTEVAGHLAIEVDPADDAALLEAIISLENAPEDTVAAAARRHHAAQYAWDTPVRALAGWLRELTGGRA